MDVSLGVMRYSSSFGGYAAQGVIVDSRLGPIAQSEAAEKIGNVVFDGFLRDIKVLCDFSIAGAGCD